MDDVSVETPGPIGPVWVRAIFLPASGQEDFFWPLSNAECGMRGADGGDPHPNPLPEGEGIAGKWYGVDGDP